MGVVAAQISRQGYSQNDGQVAPSYDLVSCALCSRVHQYRMQRVDLWLICSGAVSVRFHGLSHAHLHGLILGMM